MREALARGFLALVVVSFIVLGVFYSLETPCLEPHGESFHLVLVHAYLTHQALPGSVRSPGPLAGVDTMWYPASDDPPFYHAPPLTYGLAALLVSWTDMADLPDMLVPSPSWEGGIAPQAGTDSWNKNVYVHRPQEALSPGDTVKAVFVLRLFSLGLGGVTIVCAYALARTLWPDRPFVALGAGAFVAFNPQFIAVSAGVSSDGLLVALFSLCLLVALRLMQDGAHWSRWAMLGGLTGLALLTKQSGLLLLPLGVLAVVWQGGEEPLRWRKRLGDGSVLVAAALAVGGWWYLRSGILYGDPLGLAANLTFPLSVNRLGLDDVLMAWRSYWAAFGWTLILVEPWVYGGIGLLAALALSGAVIRARVERSPEERPALARRGMLFLGLAFLLNLASFVPWAMATGAAYGRLLFPTLAAVGALSAWGLPWWARWKMARWGLGVVVGLGLLLAAVVPGRYLRPAYATPWLEGGVPEAAETLDAFFQNNIQLAGYDAAMRELQPGREIRLTLYWRARATPSRRCHAQVQVGPLSLLDPARQVAESSAWLGGTLYPSELWRAGDVVQQVVQLSIPEDAPAPGLYWIGVSLVNEAGERVPLLGSEDEVVALGPYRMQPDVPPGPPLCSLDYRLDPAIRLLGYQLEQVEGILYVDLYWLGERPMEQDYTVFVHYLDQDGNLLGQHDGYPVDGTYPTSWWLPGEIVVDRRILHAEEPYAGSMWFQVGMYDPATLDRLPAYDGLGQRQLDDVIRLGEFVPGQTDLRCILD